jgi:hypothetical protein
VLGFNQPVARRDRSGIAASHSARDPRVENRAHDHELRAERFGGLRGVLRLERQPALPRLDRDEHALDRRSPHRGAPRT